MSLCFLTAESHQLLGKFFGMFQALTTNRALCVSKSSFNRTFTTFPSSHHNCAGNGFTSSFFISMTKAKIDSHNQVNFSYFGCNSFQFAFLRVTRGGAAAGASLTGIICHPRSISIAWIYKILIMLLL